MQEVLLWSSLFGPCYCVIRIHCSAHWRLIEHVILEYHGYSKMHHKATKRIQILSDLSRFLGNIVNATILDKKSRSEHFPRNLQKCSERTLVLEACFQFLLEGINLAWVAKVMFITHEGGDINEIRTSDVRTRSNACWKSGKTENFYSDCQIFAAQAQIGENVDTVIGQMTHTLAANSPSLILNYFNRNVVPRSPYCKI